MVVLKEQRHEDIAARHLWSRPGARYRTGFPLLRRAHRQGVDEDAETHRRGALV